MGLELAAGSSFGPYQIVGPLGRGGMASVYRARDPSLERDVALKVLPAEFLHDPAFAERFRQEAKVAARLEHPHIVPVHGFGIERGAPWMAMRLVSGGSLADRVRSSRLTPSELAALLRDVAGALDFAHARGVVHRDVKPANVLLDEGGRAYLADFGIARMLEGSAFLTATNGVLGTPSYMAPEQAMGEKVDSLADVYALGVMAFECLTGRVPYTGTTPVAVLMKHVQEPVPEPTAAEMAPEVAAVLRRCLAKAKTDRWPSASAFASALSAATTGVTPPATESVPTIELRRDKGDAPRTDRVVTGSHRREGRGRTWVWPAAGGLLSLFLVGAAYVWLPRPGLVSSPGAAVPPPTPSSATATLAPAIAAPSREPRTAMAPAPTPTATAAAVVRASQPPLETETPPTTIAPASAAIPEPRATAEPPRAEPTVARAQSGPFRVYLEAKLEPVMFQKTRAKDVADSLKDLREAIPKRDRLELAETRGDADAVVQVLERGREPAVIGVRKLRVRVLFGGETVELLGQDSMLTGFNTWSGAAGGAAKQVESWLAGRLAPAEGAKGSR